MSKSSLFGPPPHPALFAATGERDKDGLVLIPLPHRGRGQGEGAQLLAHCSGYLSRTRASSAAQPARTRAPGAKRVCPSSTAWSSSPSSVRSTYRTVSPWYTTCATA